MSEISLDIGDISLAFPLEIWILIAVSIVYGVLLVAVLLRRFCLVWYANAKYTVHRYTEIFTMWLLMFMYSFVYASALIGIYALADSGCPGTVEAACAAGALVLVATIAVSTVDVVGSAKRSTGRNCPHICTVLELLLCLYPMNCVWKMSAHLETDSDPTVNRRSCVNGLWLCSDSTFAPSVKNAKDVLCLQGVIQSALMSVVLLGSYILLPCGSWSLSMLIALGTAASSALVAILLVDWDAGHKDYNLTYGKGFLLYMLFSLLKRVIELVGGIMYYTYFLMIQGSFFFLLFAVNWLLMALTQLNLSKNSSYSRVSGFLDKAYLSFGAVWFGNFKRVSVDKEFIGEETTMMPPAFELTRYILKYAVFVCAFFLSFSSDAAPRLDLSNNLAAAILTWGTLACYALLLVILVIEFICLRRKKIRCSDCMLWVNWCKLETPVGRVVFAPAVIVVNKDMDTRNDMVYA